MNDFPDHGIAEIVLASEMVEKRALGDAGLIDDAIDAASLKAVVIKLSESGFEDLSPRFHGVSGPGCFHVLSIQTSRYVVKFKKSGRCNREETQTNAIPEQRRCLFKRLSRGFLLLVVFVLVLLLDL